MNLSLAFHATSQGNPLAELCAESHYIAVFRHNTERLHMAYLYVPLHNIYHSCHLNSLSITYTIVYNYCFWFATFSVVRLPLKRYLPGPSPRPNPLNPGLLREKSTYLGPLRKGCISQLKHFLLINTYYMVSRWFIRTCFYWRHVIFTYKFFIRRGTCLFRLNSNQACIHTSMVHCTKKNSPWERLPAAKLNDRGWPATSSAESKPLPQPIQLVLSR